MLKQWKRGIGFTQKIWNFLLLKSRRFQCKEKFEFMNNNFKKIVDCPENSVGFWGRGIKIREQKIMKIIEKQLQISLKKQLCK